MRLRDQLLSHYRLIEKIGEGGMGEVWKALDTKLDREIAIKILLDDCASDPERLGRFMREAKAVAALNHTNIVTIYSVEQVDESRFITMELIRGRSLSELIPSNGLPLEALLGRATAMADAISAAHQEGITHRDLKPANMMVGADGRLKILDFGLAKLREGAGGPQGVSELPTATVSQEGRILGTVAYMSPEQAEGKAIDHRSDIFSLGVVLYEMATGQRPFQGDTNVSIISSILKDTPEPVVRLNPALPNHLERIIGRCLEKDPNRRFQTALDLRNELETLSAEADQQESVASIAVLPFADMSPQKDQDYFCEGMAEEIINALTKIEGLHVTSRTSAFQFKASSGDIREIGRRLNVNTVLEGSVRKAGDRLRITAQLINVADDYHLWSERFDRETKDVFAIQDEIAQHIVKALRPTLSPKDSRVVQNQGTTNVQAYDYYLRGRTFFHRRGRKNAAFALQMFQRAIEIDPEYALAYAGLADCSSFTFMYSDASKTIQDKAVTASLKAVELNPELAEAHASRGLALSLDEPSDEGQREYETAIRLDPNLFEAYYFYGRSCFGQGELDKAARLFQQAAEVRPESFDAPLLLAAVHRGLGREDLVRACRRQALDVIEAHLELNPDDVRAVYSGAIALVDLGERERGLEWAARALAMDPDDSTNLYNVACAYSLAGEADKAIDTLERTIGHGWVQKDWLENDTDFESLRTHSRFQALLTRM